MQPFQHSVSSILLQGRGRLGVAIAVLAFAACRCDPPPVQTAPPELRASPAALTFATCPAQDENGQTVEDVFPDRQTFTLENLGRSRADLTWEIRGPGKDRFQIVEETKATELGASQTSEISVLFTPLAAGDVTAELVIEDGSGDTEEPVIVKLVGTGSDLPAQPTIKISHVDAAGNETECLESIDGTIDNCLVNWPDTFLDQTSTVNLKIRNLGCPSLKVTDLSVEPFSSTPVVQFFMEAPAIPPSPSTPVVLNLADGTEEMDVSIRFEPKDDGTNDGQRYAMLKVGSNAAKSPNSLITLFGYASQPAIYATPTFCDFTDTDDTCNGTKVLTSGNNKKAVFQVTNGGNSELTVDSVAFRQPASGRFAFSGENPIGQTIAPGASLPLEVFYTDAPIYVTDLIDITATAGGQSAGKATLRVSGGVLPDLYTEPDQRLDFSGATTTTTTKPLQICNGTGAGTLLVNQTLITQGGTFFKVKNPVQTGTEVAAGQCISIDIEYTKPVSGGIQAGSLQIASNDPDYGAPSHYLVNLYSEAPLDELPVAVLKNAAGVENSYSVKLSVTGANKQRLHGEDSYDPPNMPVAKYQWFLGKKPTGAVASIEDPAVPGTSIDGVIGTVSEAHLELDSTRTGEYRIYLKVFDAAGQASSNVAELKILVNP